MSMTTAQADISRFSGGSACSPDTGRTLSASQCAFDETVSATSSDGGRSCGDDVGGKDSSMTTSDARVSAMKALAGIKMVVSKSREVDAEALQHIKEQRARARAAFASNNSAGRPTTRIPNSIPSVTRSGPLSQTQYYVGNQEVCCSSAPSVADAERSSSPVACSSTQRGTAAVHSSPSNDTSASSLPALAPSRTHLNAGLNTAQLAGPQRLSHSSNDGTLDSKRTHASLDQTPSTPSFPNPFRALASTPLAASFPSPAAPAMGTAAVGQLLQEAVTSTQGEAGRASAILPSPLVNSILNLSLVQLQSLRTVVDAAIQTHASLSTPPAPGQLLPPPHSVLSSAQQLDQSLLQQLRHAQSVQQTAALLQSLSMATSNAGGSRNGSTNTGSSPFLVGSGVGLAANGGFSGGIFSQTSQSNPHSMQQQTQMPGVLNNFCDGHSVTASSLDRTSPIMQMHGGLGLAGVKTFNSLHGGQECWDEQSGTQHGILSRRSLSLPPEAALQGSLDSTVLDNNDLAFLFHSLNMGSLPFLEEDFTVPAKSHLHTHPSQQVQQGSGDLLSPSVMNQQPPPQLPRQHSGGPPCYLQQQQSSPTHATAGFHTGLFPS